MGKSDPARASDSYEPACSTMPASRGALPGRDLAPQANPNRKGRRTTPLKSTPITLFPRRDAPLWAQPLPDVPISCQRQAAKVAAFIRENGASFFDEIVEGTHLLRTQVEEALAELVAGGQVSSDSFGGLRALLTPPRHRRRRHAVGGARLRPRGCRQMVARQPNRLKQRQAAARSMRRVEEIARAARAMASCSCGCWSGRPPGCRNGVISCASIASSRRAARSEADASCPAFRASSSRFPKRWQAARGEAAGGQRKFISVSGADPLNLAGILTPGPKLAALTGNRVLYRDGIPLALLQGNEVQFLQSLDPRSEALAQMALLRHSEAAPHLRALPQWKKTAAPDAPLVDQTETKQPVDFI